MLREIQTPRPPPILLIEHPVERDVFPLLAAEFAEGYAQGDLLRPGREETLSAERVETAENPENCVLRKVLDLL